MPTLFISPEFLPSPALGKPERAMSRFFRQLFSRSLQGQWLDTQGEPVGRPIRLPEAGVRPVEFGNGQGGYAIGQVADAVTIVADIPEGAERLRIILGANQIINEVSLAALGRSSSPGPAEQRLFPPQGGTFQIDIIGDRFQSAPEFFAIVEGLHNYWTTQQFPFTEPEIKTIFAIRALFWASDSEEGNFHTPDSAIQGRVLQGNGSLVRAYQESHGSPADFVLVLINSTRRAGAGGAVFKNQWEPAWMTVTSEPFEDWRALALHELGHAFGLADEYDAPPYALDVTHFEPNVSKQSACAHAPDPWSKMCADAAEPYPSIFNDPRSVTSIRGARYTKDDWYRPHPDCLMRTPTAKFCPVCAEYLGLRFLGRVDPPARSPQS